LETVETLAHNNVYSFTSDPAIKPGIHNIDGPLDLWEGSHPVVFLEAGGHGALLASSSHSYFDARKLDFKQNTGITYIYKGQAERPRHANDRLVGYDLLSIEEHWWPRARSKGEAGQAFDAHFRYQPFGGRPGPRVQEMAGAFLGRKHGANKAKPFWGWHDMRTQNRKVLAPGQWGIDPAYAVTRNLTFPANRPVSLDYTYNPYLETVASSTAEIAPAATPNPTPAPTAATTGPGSCDIEALIDGSAEVTLGLAGRFETLAGQPVSNEQIRCTADPPPGARIRVEKKSGRGSVKLDTAGPAPRIRVDDPQRGAASYRFRAVWD